MRTRYIIALGQLQVRTMTLVAVVLLALLIGTTVIAAGAPDTNRLILITEPESSVTFSSRVPIRVRYIDPENQPIPDEFVAFHPQDDMEDTSLSARIALTDAEGVAETYIEAGIQEVDFDVKISVPDDDTVAPLTISVKVRAPGPPDQAEKLKVNGQDWDRESAQFVIDMSCHFGAATAGEHVDFKVEAKLTVKEGEKTYGLAGDRPISKVDGAVKDADNFIAIEPLRIDWEQMPVGFEGSVTVIAEVSLLGPSGKVIGHPVFTTTNVKIEGPDIPGDPCEVEPCEPTTNQ